MYLDDEVEVGGSKQIRAWHAQPGVTVRLSDTESQRGAQRGPPRGPQSGPPRGASEGAHRGK
eukprot:1532138-Pyramimonas_sp.AAC.1